MPFSLKQFGSLLGCITAFSENFDATQKPLFRLGCEAVTDLNGRKYTTKALADSKPAFELAECLMSIIAWVLTITRGFT